MYIVEAQELFRFEAAQAMKLVWAAVHAET
jgi:hypothetical protein